MGLLDNQTQNAYYTGSSFGDYQFTSLDNIINAFMVIYVGEDKIIPKVHRTDVQFHAMRAIQELSYDVFRSVKSQEIEVPNTLSMMLPQDYVNYVKIVRVGSDGLERPLYPARKTSDPFAITQDANGNYQYTGSDLLEQSPSNTSENFNSQTPVNYQLYDINYSSDVEISTEGRRYGLDPEHSQINGSYFIDNLRGLVKFGSDLAGTTITLHYISDSLGTDAEMVVHKFCEEACYKWIAYGILSTRSNVPPFIVQRFKKKNLQKLERQKLDCQI